ncbi:MAG: hypothetical protein SFY95_00170 [Planctomycetota bacterium]|nr:hypothetical protein [Planctomycetota bacterium]
MNPTPRVSAAIPYLHVADVRRSVAFYELLGMPCDGNTFEHAGVTMWASVGREPARVMLARASAPVKPEQQAAMLYLYTPDVAALRAHLLAHDVADAPYDDETPARRSEHWRALERGVAHPGGLVSQVQKRFYMPEGEIRIADPDGYILLIGQST